MRRGLVAIWVLALVGCLQPALVPCGDQLCPSGLVCVAGELCATQAQVEACSGLTDDAACQLGGGVGRCDRGACVATGCGNTVVDPGERCDDGNTVSGDGCRADCQKLEQCGDGVIDSGETCDDANTNPGDGCDACVATVWRATALIGGNTSATAQGLGRPRGVASDRNGNIYLADTDANVVRRIDTSGVITTVAGVGVGGLSGDGGPATSAQLQRPEEVLVDGLGSLYIADTGNQRVRKVDARGVITTFAGGGTVTVGGGSATLTRLGFTEGLAIDGLGEVYIADSGTHRIWKVDLAGTITVVAGTGFPSFSGDGGLATAAQLRNPSDVTLGPDGDLYIADSGNRRVRHVDAAGTITTIAGDGGTAFSGDGGPAINASIYSPTRLALDAAGALYLTASNQDRVRRVAPDGTISTVVGDGTQGFGGDGGPAVACQVDFPSGLAFDPEGRILITDMVNRRVRRVELTGTISTIAGDGTDGLGREPFVATRALLTDPGAVAVDGVGGIYVAETNGHRVRYADSRGLVRTVAGTGVFGFSGDGGPAVQAQLSTPSGLVTDAAGNLYIADALDNRIRRVDTLGVITTVAGTGVAGFGGDGGAATAAMLQRPGGLLIGPGGALYVADVGNHRIRKIDAGIITTVAGVGTAGFSGDGGLATLAELSSPTDVAFDSLGNLFVADYANYRVRKLDLAGVITTVAGDGSTNLDEVDVPAIATGVLPNSIAIDASDRLYLADPNRLRRVVNGVIEHVAGGGGGFFPVEGDGGPAAQAIVRQPTGLTFDALGRLLIAHTPEDRIRRIELSGVMTTPIGPIDPPGVGALDQALLSDPRAIVVTPALTLFAGGVSGTLQAIRTGTNWLEVVAGRYPQQYVAGALARFRNSQFGIVAGAAFDPIGGVAFLTESTQHRVHAVTIEDPANAQTWTIASLSTSGEAGFADGAVATARFRTPTGLFYDAGSRQLYVADTDNHVIRAIDLTGGVASASVRTVIGTPATLGFFGDGGAATSALLYRPEAITRCGNGDLFIADTGNHRVRRVAATDGTITTVLGVGVAASSGEGAPSSTLPVDTPRGVACDAAGNVFVTSSTTVRLLPANGAGVIDGTGAVRTIYGGPAGDRFPASVTRCLSGLAVVDATTVRVTDACTGLLVELRNETATP